MKQPTNLELTLCDGLPWGLKVDLMHPQNNDWMERKYLAHHNVKEVFGYPAHLIKPIVFPLSALTKEITISDYNDGKPFVPIYEALDHGQKEGYMNAEDRDILCYFVINPFGWKGLDKAPQWLFGLLNQWHFNTRNLSETEFINAEGLNIY